MKQLNLLIPASTKQAIHLAAGYQGLPATLFIRAAIDAALAEYAAHHPAIKASFKVVGYETKD